MKFTIALATLFAAASAKKTARKGIDLSTADVKADSKIGNRLLSKARRLDGNDEEAMRWVSGYSLKFHSCAASQDYYGGYFQDNEGNADAYQYNGQYEQGQGDENQQAANAYGEGEYGNGYYQNEQRNNYEGMYEQKLVHFKLCPTDNCGSCPNGADYVVDLAEFVDTFLEAKMTAEEYNCEQVRENCYCGDNQYEYQCLQNCNANSPFDYCDKYMENNQQNQNGQEEEEFDLQEALECKKFDFDQDAFEQYQWTNNNNQRKSNWANGNYYGEDWYQQQQEAQEEMEFFLGPYCSADGSSILLGLFVEETCSFHAQDGIYEAINYGNSLPYAKESLIGNECISCKEPSEQQYQNYYDQQDEDDITEACSQLYEQAGKCEENLGGSVTYYPNNYGCTFIKSLPEPKHSILSSAPQVTAKVFAGIFAFTTLIAVTVAGVMYKRSQRQNVSLASESNMIA
ncbi:hypothetical protein THAOC_04250 [Thalassiosira oceanica]|uniref:Uncharacterized protein n=1 Tax=Thalassiosira oceanica TaxID=159749 RepID=K0TJK8_THAOC|nr:hypothetical protein THAOC_04250 [Thalassiosira oceanica]|eukprot:EJK74096.1 hypothetical protein THAOC_04250 [Thalassiosira oceanica]